MKAAPFHYHAPEHVADAVELLMHHGDDAKVLAGGQSLVPMLAMRLARFEHLVDLGRIPELRGVSISDAGLRIGAMTTQATIERDGDVARVAPLLARATALIGHTQIRNRGTVGGSIAHADPAAEYPAVALALGAELELSGPAGTRRVGAGDFFVSTWETAAAPDEVLVAVHVPTWEGRCGFAVDEAARRHGDYAMAGVACAIGLENGSVGRAALALFAVASTPVRASAAEAALVGTAVDDVDPVAIGHLAIEDLDPPGDLHADGPHRCRMAAHLVEKAVRNALREATEGAAHG